MPDTDTKAELMPALGRMVQGLSSLFWGLPLSLIIGVQSARTDWLGVFGPVPILAVAALLLYGVHQLSYFQPHERIWVRVLDRARLVALINLGMSPFLYWWHRLPGVTFYTLGVAILVLSALVFLLDLNLLVRQLSAMLPDATLRQESQFFTTMNRSLLAAALVYIAADTFIYYLPLMVQANPGTGLGINLESLMLLLNGSFWLIVLFTQAKLMVLGLLILLPVAMTMALLWKIKEAIMASAFHSADP